MSLTIGKADTELVCGACDEVRSKCGHLFGVKVSDVQKVSEVTSEGEAKEVSDVQKVSEVTSEGVLDEVRAWLARFIITLNDRDLDLLALWIAHTHVVEKGYTTPRLAITSPLPGSGKTTTLEHIQRLANRPVQFASVTTPAALTRMIATEMRTLLIDEVDKNLRPDRPGVEDLISVLNTGYKKGGSRPTTVPDGANGWRVEELPTFAPVAMAGISPHLPDDTLTRMVSIVLLPDGEGMAEDSDWEELDADAAVLADRLAAWAFAVELPKPEIEARGRAKERWFPLMRVAEAVGGDWPDRVRDLMRAEADNLEHDREEGLMTMNPALTMLRHVMEEWPDGLEVMTSRALCDSLRTRHPDEWGSSVKYPSGLTPQRLGRYLGRSFQIRTVKGANGLMLGYRHSDVLRVARRLGLAPVNETSETFGTPETPGEWSA
jgi:hypothetical protein